MVGLVILATGMLSGFAGSDGGEPPWGGPQHHHCEYSSGGDLCH